MPKCRRNGCPASAHRNKGSGSNFHSRICSYLDREERRLARLSADHENNAETIPAIDDMWDAWQEVVNAYNHYVVIWSGAE